MGAGRWEGGWGQGQVGGGGWGGGESCGEGGGWASRTSRKCNTIQHNIAEVLVSTEPTDDTPAEP